MKHFKIRAAAWIMKFKPVQFFLAKILPGIRFSFQPPEMDGPQYKRFIGYMKPGTIVFSKDRRKLAGMLIPGRWDHVAVVAMDGMIVEAHMPKVRKIHAFDFCHSSDEVGFLIPQPWIAQKLARDCEQFIGYPYDTLFADGREALYCSELIWVLDPSNELMFNTVDEMGLGIGYVSPDDIWNAKSVVGRASCKAPWGGIEFNSSDAPMDHRRGL